MSAGSAKEKNQRILLCDFDWLSGSENVFHTYNVPLSDIGLVKIEKPGNFLIFIPATLAVILPCGGLLGDNRSTGRHTGQFLKKTCFVGIEDREQQKGTEK